MMYPLVLDLAADKIPVAGSNLAESRRGTAQRE